MNPITRAISTFTARLKTAGGIVFQGFGGGDWRSGNQGIFGRLLNRTRFDYAREVDPFQSSVTMASCLWIARNFPEAPLRVVDAKGEGIDGHPLVVMLKSPNPYYAGPLLWMATILDFTINGNAYWLKVRSGAGRPVQIYWVPSWMMRPRWPSDGSAYISHYDYLPGTAPIPYDPADVVHFRYGLDPANIRLGLSPLAAVFREIFTDEEAANFTGSLLRNLGMPGLIVSPSAADASITEEQGEAIREKFDQRFGGDGRGRTMVMLGPTAVQMVSWSPQQMNLETLRRIPEERISAALGVPAVVVGLGAGLDRATYSNMGDAREMAYYNNIIPTQRILSAELTTQLLADFGDTTKQQIDFDLSKVRALQDDDDKKWRRIDVGVQGGWITVAEGRKLVALDVKPEHEVYMLRRGTTVMPAAYMADLKEPYDTSMPPPDPNALEQGAPAPVITEIPPGGPVPPRIAPSVPPANGNGKKALDERELVRMA